MTNSSAGARRRSLRRLRALLFGATSIALTALVLAAYAGDVLEGPELDTIDARFSIRGADPGGLDEFVFVAIDGTTFAELKEQWPFRRSLHGRAIDRLREAGAKVIAYDVQFTEPTEVAEDNALIEAIDAADKVVLSTTEVLDDGETGVLGGDELLRQIGARAGNTNYVPDDDGVIRRMETEVDGLTTFGVVAADAAEGGRPEPREHSTEWIDFRGPPDTIERVSFSDLVLGSLNPAIFRDKIVVIGAHAPSLQDVHDAATGRDMAGPELQANSIATVLDGFPLGEVPGGLNVALIVLLGMVGPAVAFRFGPLRAAFAGVALAALFAVAVQLAFNGGTIVAFLYPLASLLLGVVGALGVGLALDAFERERVRDLFSRFVPEPVVDEVLKNVDEDLRLGGERRVVTVLFSDIRGFTTFSETRPPEKVIEILNRYLTTMTDVILAHGGTLVAFMGDGIMAVFGAPIETDDHADRALAAAREMAGPALDEFNEWMRAEGHGEGFRIGVGLNSGAVMAGNVGSEKRLEYTVIGDTTNTASRIEGMTKDTESMVLVADSTRLMLSGDHPELVQVGSADVRGREAQVVIWAPARPPAKDDGARW
jgi:adenylate cyclase